MLHMKGIGMAAISRDKWDSMLPLKVTYFVDPETLAMIRLEIRRDPVSGLTLKSKQIVAKH